MSVTTANLVEQASEAFLRHFDYAPSHDFRAPGRVNLIGEHTDYNDGYVLPAAIDFGTVVVAAKRSDNLIRACAVNFNEEIVTLALDAPMVSVEPFNWSNYLRAVCQQLQNRGYRLVGMDIAIVGDVPYGAGLSSSAALEIVLIRTLLALSEAVIDPTEAALVGQQAENEFIGAQTGIMDQLISARGEADHALLIDCRQLTSTPVPLDPDFNILIFHSNVRRGLVDSEYNTRRLQCQAAAKIMQISHLRDADLALLDRFADQMDTITYRRARHVISENERTLLAASTLANRDWASLGELMQASHNSMRDDFEITVPAIDGLVALIQERLSPGMGGVRMTGGGFGGCVVALVHKSQTGQIIEHVADHYHAAFGLHETVYICQAVDGAFVAQ